MDAKEKELTLELYKSYLGDVAKIGDRHETVRAFYLSLVTTVFGFLALTGEGALLQQLPASVMAIVGLIGIAVCVAWFFHMWSFSQLFTAKFDALRTLETAFEMKPFTVEQSALQQTRRVRITLVDRLLAVIFGIFYLALWAFKNVL